jgi:hypothetical protein
MLKRENGDGNNKISSPGLCERTLRSRIYKKGKRTYLLSVPVRQAKMELIVNIDSIL